MKKIIINCFTFLIGFYIATLIPLHFTFIECIVWGLIVSILFRLLSPNTKIKVKMSKRTNTNTETNKPHQVLYNHSNLYFVIVESKMAQGLYQGTSGTTWFENYYIYSPSVNVYIKVEGTLEIRINSDIVQAPTVKFLSLYDNSVLDQIVYTGSSTEYKHQLAMLSSKYKYETLYATSAASYINEYKSKYLHDHNAQNNKSEYKDSSSTNDTISLFSGCKDADSLKKRYLQLLKVYHPDNSNGDTEMTQRIQQEYNILKAQL